MIYILHRTNSTDALSPMQKEWGAEIDIRYHENNLILTHDPFGHHQQNLTTLEDFLKHWHFKGPLILNVKTEGVEKLCIELMNQYKVNNWFFLDLSMPYFVKFAKLAKENSIEGFRPENLAVRFSDKEPIEYALHFTQQAEWVWVDWFDQIVLTKETFSRLKNAGFKLCLVSPELQGKELDQIQIYKNQLKVNAIDPDAVCTKRPDLWK